MLIQQNGKISVPPHRRESYKQFLESTLDKEVLEEKERMTVRGIIAYLARIYGRRLPSPFPKLWGKVKAKFEFQDSPARDVRQVNAYMPDLPHQGGGEE